MIWNGDCSEDGCEREAADSSGLCASHRPDSLVVFDGPARRCIADGTDQASRVIAAEVWDSDDYCLASNAPGAVVVDIGANVGLATLAALAHGAERVVAVEPDEINRRLLHANLELSGVADLVEVREEAVAASETVRVVRRDPNVGGDALSGRSWTDTFLEPGAAQVRALPLDALAPPDDNLVVKIDTEGAEYEAIAGASDSLLSRIRWLAIEYHSEPRRGLDSARRLPALIGRLLPTHDIEVRQTFEPGVGMLYGSRR